MRTDTTEAETEASLSCLIYKDNIQNGGRERCYFAFVCFYTVSPSAKKALTSTVEKKENFLGKTTVCQPKNVWGILDFGFADEGNGS